MTSSGGLLKGARIPEAADERTQLSCWVLSHKAHIVECRLRSSRDVCPEHEKTLSVVTALITVIKMNLSERQTTQWSNRRRHTDYFRREETGTTGEALVSSAIERKIRQKGLQKGIQDSYFSEFCPSFSINNGKNTI